MKEGRDLDIGAEFSRNVDELLRGARAEDCNSLSDEYRANLEFAEMLARTRFRPTLLFHARLKQSLLRQLEPEAAGPLRVDKLLNSLIPATRGWRVSLVTVLLVLLVSTLVLAIPSTRAVAQETFERAIPWIPCVVRTEQGYVVYAGTRGPFGTMRWEPITPPLPPNPVFYIMEMSAASGVCPDRPGAILWGYTRLGLLLAGLFVGLVLSVYAPTRARIINGIRGLRERVWRPRMNPSSR